MDGSYLRMFNACRVRRLNCLLRRVTICLILVGWVRVLPGRPRLCMYAEGVSFEIKIRRRNNHAFRMDSLGRARLFGRSLIIIYGIIFVRASASFDPLTRWVGYYAVRVFGHRVQREGAVPHLTRRSRRGTIWHDSLRFLVDDATPLMMLSSGACKGEVKFGHGLWMFLITLFFRVSVRGSARRVAGFVESVLRRFLNVDGSTGIPLIISAGVRDTALYVNRATCPFRVFISPEFFVFCILIF